MQTFPFADTSRIPHRFQDKIYTFSRIYCSRPLSQDPSPMSTLPLTLRPQNWVDSISLFTAFLHSFKALFCLIVLHVTFPLPFPLLFPFLLPPEALIPVCLTHDLPSHRIYSGLPCCTPPGGTLHVFWNHTPEGAIHMGNFEWEPWSWAVWEHNPFARVLHASLKSRMKRSMCLCLYTWHLLGYKAHHIPSFFLTVLCLCGHSTLQYANLVNHFLTCMVFHHFNLHIS